MVALGLVTRTILLVVEEVRLVEEAEMLANLVCLGRTFADVTARYNTNVQSIRRLL